MAAKFKILLVDDDPNIAHILEHAAAQLFPEAAFTLVNSYKEASKYLDDLEGRGPDLVLLDIHLQIEPNGLEFLTLMRGHSVGRLIPIIILTVITNRTFTQEAYIRGANAFTIKPESYEGWKSYVEQLRLYWFQTATLPRPYFTQA